VKPRFFETPAEFNAWLKANHAKKTELIVGFHKTKTGKPSLTWPQSVDEALCYGWIDGRRTSLGEHSYMIRFTPRKPKSIWSAINIRRVAELTAEKRMTTAGLRIFEQRTERNATGYSYEQRKTIELDPAAEKKFRAKAKAWKYFEDEAPWYRASMKHWVMSAKKEETREQRLGILIECSARGERHPDLIKYAKKK
jgi:uncharacterized protein YdeI (YjbR/CyaY-like superfamily)